ncbi:MAG: hypothetical protein ACTSPM_08295 [Candidatus Heimdallarchaeota archaeon]
MNTISLFWGYLIGEEHLTEEQFASIDFGDPPIDTEFITFDPLASSYFQGKYYRMKERKFFFPHRTLPAMRSENMVIYEATKIKILDPPTDLETPAGIFLCIFTGKKPQIKRAIDFLSKKINLRFSPCEIDLEQFYLKLSKTRLKVIPQTTTVSDLAISDSLSGNLEVITHTSKTFLFTLKTYKPKIRQIKVQIKEVSFLLDLEINLDGSINISQDIDNLNLLETVYDVASRSVFTG